MYLIAFFTDDSQPATGLTPTVSVLRVSDDTIVVNAQSMTESNLSGYYYYDFSSYDDSEEYAITADGGSSLADEERYKHGGSLAPTATEVRDAILADSTPFNGANVDVAISSRSSHSAADAADAVWDELIADHLGGDKAGQHLEDADATADPSAVADAVWDEATSGHVSAGTFGKLAQDVLDGQSVIRGLLHENAVIDQQSYDGDGNLESARLRCYDSKANAEAAGATGLLYTFSIAAIYTSGLLSSYTLVREP